MINCRWISKQMEKTLKIFWWRKSQKNKAFHTPCENFTGLAKIPNIISHTLRKPIRTPYEKFAHPTLQKCFAKLHCKKACKIREDVRTHFATLEKFCKPCANSNNLCQNQRSLKSLFKPLQALFSFCTPHLLIAKVAIILRRPNFHSFSPLDASSSPI